MITLLMMSALTGKKSEKLNAIAVCVIFDLFVFGCIFLPA